MQSASDAFDTAAATHRTFVPSRTRTDWDGTGYSGDGTIDDLSPQVSEAWSVEHALDDGYPSSVSFVSGTGVPQLAAELAGRPVGGAPTTAKAYWSPLRTDSAIYGYDRDIAPVTHDVGLVTASGPEYVRVFTGQMVNTPVKGDKATLETISASRVALMKSIQPPGFPAMRAGGLRASWMVSYALYACGLYAGAAPRTSTIMYYPMHGSMWRFHGAELPYGNALTSSELWWIRDLTATSDVTTVSEEVDWIPGPYVAAPGLQLTSSLSRRTYTFPFAYRDTTGQAAAFSQAGDKGRLELWVRGDAADVNQAPGGSGTISRLCGLQIRQTGLSGPSVAMGVDTSRRVYVTVYDGTNTRTLTSAAMPTDTAWHFVGAAYDMTADRLWVNLDGVVSSSTTTMLTAGLPATDASYYNSDTFILSYLPFSDLTFSTGVQANVDNYPLWRNDTSFAPTATVGLSQNQLVASAEDAPVEAWQLITRYAQAEAASLRPDELDHVLYLPQGYWVQAAQQLVTETLSTERNAAAFDVDLDPSKIRNVVTVKYAQRSLPKYSIEQGTFRPIFALQTNTHQVQVPPGLSTLVCTLSDPACAVVQDIAVYDGIGAVAGMIGPILFTVGFVAQGLFRRPEYDPIAETVSALEVARLYELEVLVGVRLRLLADRRGIGPTAGEQGGECEKAERSNDHRRLSVSGCCAFGSSA